MTFSLIDARHYTVKMELIWDNEVVDWNLPVFCPCHNPQYEPVKLKNFNELQHVEKNIHKRFIRCLNNIMRDFAPMKMVAYVEYNGFWAYRCLKITNRSTPTFELSFFPRNPDIPTMELVFTIKCISKLNVPMTPNIVESEEHENNGY